MPPGPEISATRTAATFGSVAAAEPRAALSPEGVIRSWSGRPEVGGPEVGVGRGARPGVAVDVYQEPGRRRMGVDRSPCTRPGTSLSRGG